LPDGGGIWVFGWWLESESKSESFGVQKKARALARASVFEKKLVQVASDESILRSRMEAVGRRHTPGAKALKF
jgi:ribosomal protein L20A (L18A)